jgi:hypothetical protein
MSNSHSIIIAALAFSITTSTLASDVVSCDHIQRFRPKGSRQASLKLTYEHNTLQRFEYSGITASGEEAGAYTCYVDLQRNKSNTRWVTHAGVTQIWFDEYLDVDVDVDVDVDEASIKIKRNGKTIDVQMYVPPTPYCGFGAKFPSHVVKLSDGRCRVSL